VVLGGCAMVAQTLLNVGDQEQARLCAIIGACYLNIILVGGQ